MIKMTMTNGSLTELYLNSFVDFLSLLGYALCQQGVEKYVKAYESIRAVAIPFINQQSSFNIQITLKLVLSTS